MYTSTAMKLNYKAMMAGGQVREGMRIYLALTMQPTSTRILVHICVLPLEIRISRPNQQFHIAIMPLLARGEREAHKHTRRGGRARENPLALERRTIALGPSGVFPMTRRGTGVCTGLLEHRNALQHNDAGVAQAPARAQGEMAGGSGRSTGASSGSRGLDRSILGSRQAQDPRSISDSLSGNSSVCRPSTAAVGQIRSLARLGYFSDSPAARRSRTRPD